MQPFYKIDKDFFTNSFRLVISQKVYIARTARSALSKQLQLTVESHTCAARGADSAAALITLFELQHYSFSHEPCVFIMAHGAVEGSTP